MKVGAATRINRGRPNYYVRLLRRHRWLLIAIVAIITGASVALSYAVDPRFDATAIVGVKSNETQPTEIKSVVRNLPTDPFSISTEVYRIGSPAFVARVVDRLMLAKDPEFNGTLASIQPLDSPATKKGLILDAFHDVSVYIASWLRSFESPIEHRDDDERTRVSDTVLKRLDVQQLRGSNAIKITFISINPRKAALIANTLATQYINEQLDAKLATTERLRMALQSRLDFLLDPMLQSKAALEQYRTETGMIEVQNRDGYRVTLATQHLSYLNEQYVQARLTLSADEARLRELDNLIQSGRDIEAAPAVLSSEMVLRLREQEAEVIRRQGEAIKSYGEKHPKLQSIRAELSDARANIKREIDKIVSEMKNKVLVARASEKDLKEQLQRQTALAAKENQFLARLIQLENVADSHREIYEAFLTRTQEVSEQNALYGPDAEMISAAMVPTKKSFPPRKLIVAFALVAGTTIAIVVILLIDRLAPKIRSPEQLRDLTGVQTLGVVPAARDLDVRNPPAVVGIACHDMLTRFLANRDHTSSKVAMITSSVPNEGKTSTAVGLAFAVRNFGGDCLLVDCDFRCSRLHEVFSIDRAPGMAELLNKMCSLDDVVHHDETSGIDFVTAGSSQDKSLINLNPIRIEETVSLFRSRYPIVIIDTPPLLAVSDALLWARHSDATLLAVRWESTDTHSVVTALQELSEIDELDVYGFLTMVDTRVYARYGFSDAPRYSNAYARYYAA